MKKVTIFLILSFISTTSFSQIQFGQLARDGKIACPSLPSEIKLPITFKFHSTFKTHTFSISKDSAGAPIISKGTFGEKIGHSPDDGSYTITIKSDGIVSYLDGESTPSDLMSFYVVIDDKPVCGPFKLKREENEEPGTAKAYEPGFLYYDALTLHRLKNTTIADSIALVKRILKFYGFSKDSAQINPFLPSVLFSAIEDAEVQGAGKSSIFSTVGGLDVTKYANAIADLMIERAKQELTVAFFDRFKKFAEYNPEFQILFPKTTENLSNLLSYTYPQMLPALRDGFFEDLKMITYNLDDVLDLPRYQRLLANYPEIRIAIRSLRIVHEIENGASNAADVILGFSSFDEWIDPASSINIKRTGSYLKIAALFSESIRNNPDLGNEIWVPAKELKRIFYDKSLFETYTSLLYQRAKIDDIKYIDAAGRETKFSQILKDQQNNLFRFQTKLKEFFDLAGNVNIAYKNLRDKINNDQTPGNDDIYNYIDVSLNAIEYAFSLVRIVKEVPVADKYLALARKSNSLYKSIYSKQYSQAVSDAIEVLSMISKLINKEINYDSLKSQANVKNFSTNNKSVSSLIEGDKFLRPVKDADVIAATKVEVADPAVAKVIDHYNLDHVLEFIEKLRPYALFIANMVEADTEAEVKAALENVILPVGSSSIKKNSDGNISVQTYLGAFVSVSNGTHSKGYTWSDKVGITAPIGISWTPRCLSWRKGGSLSTFISLLDLGAIVDYKLKQDSANGPVYKDYKVELGQIFSPGVHLVYGFPWNLPLSLGFGAQYGPGLSKIEDEEHTVIANPKVRFSFFLAVDMPFFTLKNKNRNANKIKNHDH